MVLLILLLLFLLFVFFLIVFLLIFVLFINLVLLFLKEFEIILGVLVVRVQGESLFIGINGLFEISEPVLDVPSVVERAGFQLRILGGFRSGLEILGRFLKRVNFVERCSKIIEHFRSVRILDLNLAVGIKGGLKALVLKVIVTFFDRTL